MNTTTLDLLEKNPVSSQMTNDLWVGYHVTVLSNFVRGYDKYSHHYSKTNIAESTFENQFFLLSEEDLEIGVKKAKRLLEKLNLPQNEIMVMKTKVPRRCLKNDHVTGVGFYVPQNYIRVDAVYLLEEAA